MNKKVIGIIGGMGPEATADLFLKIIQKTKAEKDQDHFRIIIDNNPHIPDRTKAILYGGESPVKALIETAKNLEKSGVDIACIPCMTAHYFIEEIQKNVSYPILNAFDVIRKHIFNNYPNIKNIGVLATTGTVKTGIFEKYLNFTNVIYPSSIIQKDKVMEAIYGEKGIKRGVKNEIPLNLLKDAAKYLISQGVELLIFGCTEIGLVLKQEHVEVPVIDPMDILADELIKQALTKI
ncbi:aspartate racemase [Anaerobranca californiensis DSM 14826]|jgi:aspartate racemase|uniref:Aspartate racemase n=1 Tax=Anaerobranca californiensis DSM 14826 TaxID=1120989 RepID=A0A1M6M530_9FIRM|nr:amino acid racemase [Anaerobranca californiensis]SHJ78537.1 aspartate racemase [Anaerobranca californiensis DSM 14826]